jgi:hypothetical protein
VTFHNGRRGKPDTVSLAIGRKVRIVAPVARCERKGVAPRRRKTASASA